MRLVAPLDESTRSILPQFQTSDGVRANENAIATRASGLSCRARAHLGLDHTGRDKGLAARSFRRPSIRAICVFRPGTGMSAALVAGGILVSLLKAVEPNSPTRRWPRDAQTKKNKAAA